MVASGCPRCAAPVAADARRCPACGAPLPPGPRDSATPPPSPPRPIPRITDRTRERLGGFASPSPVASPVPSAVRVPVPTMRPAAVAAPLEHAAPTLDDDLDTEIDEAPLPLPSPPARASAPPPRATTPPPRASTPPPPPRLGSAPPGPDPTAPPPPTRVLVARTSDRGVPVLDPVPEPPESGVLGAVRYSIGFARARWQRGKAIRVYRDVVRDDTRTLDALLYELGTAIRGFGIENRATSPEMRAIDAAEQRRAQLGGETADLERRRVEEQARGAELAAEREAKVADAEQGLEAAGIERDRIEDEKKALRERRKVLERQQRGYLKGADDKDALAGKLPLGEARNTIRATAEALRRQAAELDPERQESERRLAALERPHAQAVARVDALKGEVLAARRALEDAREGHRHRLAELDAEQGRKGKDAAAMAGEIHQRLVTLGTIVNLNRVERPELDAIYDRIDTVREAIGTRSRLIDRLGLEREGYDRGALLRGGAALGGAAILVLTIILVLVDSL